MNRSLTHRGPGYVPSYQISGIPFITGSLLVPDNTGEPLEVQFSHITKFITIRNILDPAGTSKPIRFGFSSDGVKGTVNNNYNVLKNGESYEGDLRVSKLFLISDSALTSSGSVIAGMTDIPSTYLVPNWSGSYGVG